MNIDDVKLGGTYVYKQQGCPDRVVRVMSKTRGNYLRCVVEEVVHMARAEELKEVEHVVV